MEKKSDTLLNTNTMLTTGGRSKQVQEKLDSDWTQVRGTSRKEIAMSSTRHRSFKEREKRQAVSNSKPMVEYQKIETM